MIGEEVASLVALRHDIHAHPELMYEEKRTSAIVQRELQAAGVSFIPDLAGGTGVLAAIAGKRDKAIALRADMDALPIIENTKLPYKSTIPGRMHACGHDGHTAILIGTARVLAKLAKEHELPHPITLFFQPAEEGGGGAARMIEDGCLDGSRIGAPVGGVFGLHGWPWMPLGCTGTRVGALLASSDRFVITVTGKGVHAAWPHLGRDPVLAAAAIIQSLQAIVSRAVDPIDSAVVSVCALEAGNAFNVIPQTATMKGTFRSIRQSTRDLIRSEIGRIASSLATAHGCSADIEFSEGYPMTFNDAAAVETFRTAARATVGEARVINVENPAMGAEDFSFYAERVPSCFFLLGLRGSDSAPVADLHSPNFDFNDGAIPIGIESFCRIALGDSFVTG